MNIRKFKGLFRDTAYDHRKILNSEELIKIARQMGYTQIDIAEACNVSKTMISHWGNLNKSEKPTYTQLEPMMEKYGRGRFNVELEPLSTAAVEYRKFDLYLAQLLPFVFIFIAIWLLLYKPCSDNWDECRNLPWYKMPSYQAIKTNESIEKYKEWKKSSENMTSVNEL
jgi:transcriptional regulator with XRE-family HTH domain